jgi:hypothetical protein
VEKKSGRSREPSRRTNMLYPCPACGFEVYDGPAGSYAVCPVCDWEDDPVQLRFPAMRGGANRASLFEWQEQLFLEMPPEVAEHKGWCRCPDWRPLTEEECRDTTGMPTTGLAYFEAVSAVEPVYYWRKKSGGSD